MTFLNTHFHEKNKQKKNKNNKKNKKIDQENKTLKQNIET